MLDTPFVCFGTVAFIMQSYPLFSISRLVDIATSFWLWLSGVSSESPATRQRVYQVGMTYSIYRTFVSFFLMMGIYFNLKDNRLESVIPTVFEAILSGSYLVVSLVALVIFYLIDRFSRHQLITGFVVDLIFLTAYVFHGTISTIQTIFLLIILVAVSFVVLPLSRAGIVILMTILAFIYQGVAKTLYFDGTSLSISELFFACLCIVAAGFLSWSVTQRLYKAETQLAQQSQEVEKLNLINHIVVKNMVNGVLVVNENRDVIMVNEATVRLLRLPHTDLELRGSPQKMFEFGQLVVQHHPAITQWYRSIDPNLITSWIYELSPDSSNPSDKLRLNNRPLGSHGQLVIIEDIGREQSHAQRLKLESLGQLSASIAHEIRNPLGAISHASQLLMVDDSASTENLELYQMIFQQTRRVNDIIEDVLSLSRQEIPDQEAIDIYRWVNTFIRNHYPSNNIMVYLQPKYDYGTTIYFDPNHLEQIMVNLVNNALRHTNPVPNRADVDVYLSRVEDKVFIDVIDNGSGVPDNEIPMLFHPFFTTSKKGTGLGLYLSQSFSEANNAKIRYLKDDRSCFRLIASCQRRTA